MDSKHFLSTRQLIFRLDWSGSGQGLSHRILDDKRGISSLAQVLLAWEKKGSMELVGSWSSLDKIFLALLYTV
jgi:hypothetical protein